MLLSFVLAFQASAPYSSRCAAQGSSKPDKTAQLSGSKDSIQIVVLGVAQDAGFPQAACDKTCCKAAWENKSLRRMVASLGLIDHSTGQRWIFDCSPDFPDQLRLLNQASLGTQTGAVNQSEAAEQPDAKNRSVPLQSPPNTNQAQIGKSNSIRLNTFEFDPKQLQSPTTTTRLDGIFLTHAHVGHYAGLINLGREVMGSKNTPTYVMPRLSKFLQGNGPWSQLVKLKNIELKPMLADQPIQLNGRISVTPFQVPHRDEFSETVGFKITGPSRTVVFLPDIDKWSKWNQSIQDLIKQVDVAYLDGTFFENGEIPGRDMALIPHPFVKESINHFSALDESDRKKVRFIHFNHTNPVLQPASKAARQIEQAGMGIAVEGEVIELSDKKLDQH